jgi:hypothetical protein
MRGKVPGPDALRGERLVQAAARGSSVQLNSGVARPRSRARAAARRAFAVGREPGARGGLPGAIGEAAVTA